MVVRCEVEINYPQIFLLHSWNRNLDINKGKQYFDSKEGIMKEKSIQIFVECLLCSTVLVMLKGFINKTQVLPSRN